MSPVDILPMIEVEGDPYNCGKNHGEIASSLIEKSIEAYLRLFEFHAGLDRQNAILRSQTYVRVVRESFPELMEELQGIADGSGRTLEEIMMLNCRTELLSTSAVRSCTSVAALPPATRSGQVILGQTWDWLSATEGTTVILKVKRIGKPPIIMLTEAGQIGKMGLTEAGFGLCHNWLETDYQKTGIPFLIFCRALLDCSDIASAINLFYQYPRATAGNFLLAHKEGFAMDFEATPDDVDFIEPERGLIVHTNHFLSPRFRTLDAGLKKEGGDSLVRRQRAITILSRNDMPIDLSTMFEMQSDRSCGPYSICISPLEDEPFLARWMTLAGMVIDLTNLQLHIALGNPTLSNYRQYFL